MSRRLVSGGLSVLLLAGGCNLNRNAPDPRVAAPSAALPPAEQAAPTPGAGENDEPIDTRQLLAARTAAYARSIREQLNARSQAQSAPDPSSSLPDVRWIEAQQFRLTLASPQDPAGPYPTSRPSLPDGTDTPSPNPAAVGMAPATQAAQVPVPPPRQPLPPTSDHLEIKLAQQIRDYPNDVIAHLDYQLIQLLRGRQVPQLEAIASLPAEDREVIAALMDALSNFRSMIRGEENILLSRKARPLIELADRLRTGADLRIPTIALCARVDAFGVYEPVDSARFVAGREHTAIVYCEVENFYSSLNERKQWQTSLTQELLVYNERGQRVWDDKRRAVTDVSRNRRRDFFVARLIKLPAMLTPGRYYLKVSITDQQSGRATEASLPIQVVAEK